MSVKGEKGKLEISQTKIQDLHHTLGSLLKASLHWPRAALYPSASWSCLRSACSPGGMARSWFSGTGAGLGRMPVGSQWLLPQWKAWCRPVFGTLEWTLDSVLPGGRLSSDLL